MALNILHTADWHLGQTFFNYDRTLEHKAFLQWLLDTIASEAIDVLLIAGDVFDVANPSAVAQQMYYAFLQELKTRFPHVQVVVIAGNHDSPSRLETTNAILESMGVHVVGKVNRLENREIDTASHIIPLYDAAGNKQAYCLAVPFVRQGDYLHATREQEVSYAEGVLQIYKELTSAALAKEDGLPLIATGHMHVLGSETSADDNSERAIMGGLEYVNADQFDEAISYLALGHIHKSQRIDRRGIVRYAGSPLPMSFSEIGYAHQVLKLTIDGNATIEPQKIAIPLFAPLVRIPAKPEPLDMVLEQLRDWSFDASSFVDAPYLEVRVLNTEPNPTMRYQIEEALKDKTCKLARISVHNPNIDEAFSDFEQLENESLDIDPGVLLTDYYRRKYGEEIPQDMQLLFEEILTEAYATQED